MMIKLRNTAMWKAQNKSGGEKNKASGSRKYLKK